MTGRTRWARDLDSGPLDAVDAGVRAAGRAALERWPALRRPLLTGRDLWARATVRTRTCYNDLRYVAPIDPYRLLRVDPAAIERYPGSFPKPKFQYAGVVVGGDWDRDTVRFTDLEVYRAYERHFVDGVPWQETAFYEGVVSDIEAGQPQWGCETRADFDRRCARLDALYESMRTEGYRSQADLHAASGTDPFRSGHRTLTDRFDDELAVHVGRDGDLLFGDGRNRLAMAKLLGLESIPVRVLLRHREWQRTRDDYVRGLTTDPALRDHPDLTYLRRDRDGSVPSRLRLRH